MNRRPQGARITQPSATRANPIAAARILSAAMAAQDAIRATPYVTRRDPMTHFAGEPLVIARAPIRGAVIR